MKKKLLIVVVCMLCVILPVGLAGCQNKDNFNDEYFVHMNNENSAMADGSNIRVMSANVLVHMKSWGGSKVSPRAEIFAEVLKHFAPDVVGLQEFCGCYYKEMPMRIDNYELLSTKKSDYTTMMYNTEKVKLLEEGKVNYSKESNKNCRFIVWGLFEKLESGEKFIVTSTHWDFGMETKKVEMRKAQIKELSELVNQLMKTYEVPVFAVGDYNSFENTVNEGAESYVEFLDVSKMRNAKFEENVERNCSVGWEYDNQSYDHIFIKGNVEAKAFNILYKTYYEILSDHPLIYLDAKI